MDYIGSGREGVGQCFNTQALHYDTRIERAIGNGPLYRYAHDEMARRTCGTRDRRYDQ